MTFRHPNERMTLKPLVALLLVVATTAFVAGTSASAATPTNGCPQAFEFISVAQAESEGYSPTPRLTDEAVGAPLPGNHDGFVCRRPLGDGVAHDFPGRPDTVYVWLDNRVG